MKLITRKYFELFTSVGLLLTMIAIGTLGYIIIEGWSFLDSFFMTVITMTTVGFGEVRPLSDLGMWFTSILIIFSFGIFAYTVSTLTRFVVDGVTQNYFKDRLLKKKIEKLNNHVILCGYGRNGKQAAMELTEHNIPFVLIEGKQERVEAVIEKHPNYLVVHGNAIQEDTLKEANIEKATALITTLPADADNLYVVLSARYLKPSLNIISRATDENSDNKLKSAGASSVIMPDRIGGRRMAKLVTQPDVLEFIEFLSTQSSSKVGLVEVECYGMRKEYIGKSISELQLQRTVGVNIVGIKRGDMTLEANPGLETNIYPEDKLFVLGEEKGVRVFTEVLTG